LLNAVTDYASISIVNARLFKALEERARRLQEVADAARAGELSKDERFNQMREEVRARLAEATRATEVLLTGEKVSPVDAQNGLLHSVQENLQHITQIIEAGKTESEGR
jgi:hypothetical protein